MVLELLQLARSLPALREPSLVSPESFLRALHLLASHLNVSLAEARHIVNSLHLDADVSLTSDNTLSLTSVDFSCESDEVLRSTTNMKRSDCRNAEKVSSKCNEGACTSKDGLVDSNEHITFGNLVAGELRSLRCPDKRNRLKCLILKAILQVCEEGDSKS